MIFPFPVHSSKVQHVLKTNLISLFVFILKLNTESYEGNCLRIENVWLNKVL